MIFWLSLDPVLWLPLLLFLSILLESNWFVCFEPVAFVLVYLCDVLPCLFEGMCGSLWSFCADGLVDWDGFRGPVAALPWSFLCFTGFGCDWWVLLELLASVRWYGLLLGLCRMMFGGSPFMIHSCYKPSSGESLFFGSHSRHLEMKLTNWGSGISLSLFIMYFNLSSFCSSVRTSSGAGTALSLNWENSYFL